MKLKVFTSVSALLLSSFLAQAGVYKIAGYTFDEANSVRKATIVEGPVLNTYSSRSFARFSEDYASRPGERINLYRNFDHGKSIGKLVGSSGRPSVSRHVTLPEEGDSFAEANVHRSTIELTWDKYALPNKPGPDFVVYEVGEFEVFAVAVRKAGSSEFTHFRYQFPNNYERTHEVNSVAFDLTDFGIAEGESIAAIRIRNVFTSKASAGADRVDHESGQGRIVYPGDPNYQNAFPIRFKAGDKEVTAQRLGADIVYVVGLHDIVPLSEEGAQASK